MMLFTLDINDPYILIIGASLVLVYSFLSGLISQKTNVPSVLLLIIGGLILGYVLKPLGVNSKDLMPSLEILGIVGLIMIVLEAALDLELSRDKAPLIKRTLYIAFLALIFSSLIIAGIFVLIFDMEWLQACLYATPLSIMSSAIIIPSVEGLSHDKKEFMIYESAFSDILGIMLFYFIISLMESGGAAAGTQFIVSLVITIVVAVASSYAIVYVFKDLKSSSRLFLLIAILLILYSAGKLFHLSPLLIILIFGLSLANHKIFFKIFRNDLKKENEEDGIDRIEKEFHLITMETAFVVRTFFFVIFGMTIDLGSLLNFKVFLISMAVLVCLYAVRWVVLTLFLKKEIMPELTLAPRGLITILLFFGIPVIHNYKGFDAGILLYVIILSSLVMTYGLIKDGQKKAE